MSKKMTREKLKKMSLKTPLIWSRAWQHPCVQVDYLKVTITMFGFVIVTATATSSYTTEQRSRFVSLLCLNWWRKPKSETLHPLEKRTKLSEHNEEVAKLDRSCWISSKLLCAQIHSSQLRTRNIKLKIVSSLVQYRPSWTLHHSAIHIVKLGTSTWILYIF